MMNTERIAMMIQTSADRVKIEQALIELYGTPDITKITDKSIETFIRAVLPQLSPDTFGR